MASSINLNRLFPLTNKMTLPEVTTPDCVDGNLNGVVEKTPTGYNVQWIPTDTYKRYQAHGNKDYDERSLYKLNKHCFRADDFKSTKYSNKKKIMFAGCSHTFGIGVDQHETYADIICKEYDAVNWNIGAGGIGNETIVLNITQMIDNGYIPDILYVQWTYLHRQLMITDTNKHSTLSTKAFAGKPDSRYHSPYFDSYCDYMKNKINNATWGDSVTSLNNQLDDLEDYSIEDDLKELYHWHGKDDGKTQSLRAGEYFATFGYKALLNHYYLLRENVINLCKLHNIVFKEIHADMEIAEFIAETVIPNKGYTTGDVPVTIESLSTDYGRDNEHFGKESHKAWAKYLMDHTNEE
jgi:hypothetical protein